MENTNSKKVMTPIIEVKGIHKQFPGVYALKGVNFDLYSGEVHALMGENGAGKSTLIKIIAGAYDYQQGEYRIDGNKVDIQNPLDAINKGISVIYQELNLVASVSVAENIYFGRLPTTKMGRVLWKKLYQNSEKVLEQVGLNISPKTKVQYLSVAQQQLVEIAKALSVNSKVIIMDEPTSAISPNEIENLFKLILKLKENGVGIIYISHKLEEIFKIADRITVFRDGEHIGTEKTSNLDEDGLISMMVGRKMSDMFPKTKAVIGDKILETKSLTTHKVNDISFYVKKGEILGFSGLMGSGRTELAHAIFGADERISGEVWIDGKKLPTNSPVLSQKMGIGLVPENRKDDGILPNLSVKKNITIVSLAQLTKRGRIDSKEEKSQVLGMIKNLSIKTPTMDQLVAKLSGGNQQKVIVARWLMKKNLKVLIIDEPTRGIDVGAKAEIYTILDQLACSGMAIIMMSSEMQEILGICDRIYVMKSGSIVGEYSREEATQEKLLKDAIS